MNHNLPVPNWVIFQTILRIMDAGKTV